MVTIADVLKVDGHLERPEALLEEICHLREVVSCDGAHCQVQRPLLWGRLIVDVLHQVPHVEDAVHACQHTDKSSDVRLACRVSKNSNISDSACENIVGEEPLRNTASSDLGVT